MVIESSSIFRLTLLILKSQELETFTTMAADCEFRNGLLNSFGFSLC